MFPNMEDQQVFEKLWHLIEEYFISQSRGPFLKYLPPGELRRRLELDAVEKNGDWDVVFSWIEKYLAYSVKTNNPGFVNRMWTGSNMPAVIGEIITAISNTSACTYESAPVSTIMEKYMIEQMLDLVGFANGAGQMTTGSSNANMIAMMAARNTVCQNVKKLGLFGQHELYAFVSAEAHYSMDKAANILGIGTEHLIKVPVNTDACDRGRTAGSMDIEALQEQLTAVAASGGVPFFVGATAGTTVRGAYDGLHDLLELREQYKFWLHVDGAWGGAVVVSEKLRGKFLAGLEKVDSFTMDFHKMFGTALMCNVLLVNGAASPVAGEGANIFSSVCGAGDSSYIFRSGEEKEQLNLGAQSLQCGRRVDSLKWFLDWKFYGQAGFARRIEKYYDLCGYAEECVEMAPELEMVAPRESFNICFRYKAPSSIINEFNLALRTRLYEDGVSLVGYAYIGGDLTLRLLICNDSFGEKEIADFFNGLLVAAQKLMKEW